MRLIDADALSSHKFLSPAYMARANSKTLTAIYQQGWNDAIDAIIDNAPTVDVDDYERAYNNGYHLGFMRARERPQGEWINREAVSNTTFPFWERYECNKCHKYNGYSNFCPNCGTDMRVKDELNNELNNELNERPQTIGCFNCKHYCTIPTEKPCKCCNDKFIEWQAKDELGC